ncbi:Maf-like protein [Oryzibacter oryziterrae]|uniref:Maf-like protein n=1 Tax=Oryzibacter oryziterrae TaxID=2766474 RepID=UPI001F305F7E|nr:Maf-like protein [Oryzibacter oryziterrae]
MTLILASGSAARAAMLTQAGLIFERARPDVDERAVEESVADSGISPEDMAQILADVKATEVSTRHPGAWVIGADQTLALVDELFHKPDDLEAARRQLQRLSGRTHHLHAAVSVARNGEILFRHVSSAALTMRELSPMFLGQYLSIVGDSILSSVGGYQIESLGIQLFEEIDGDHFTILGLPLLPLLDFLRQQGLVDA